MQHKQRQATQRNTKPEQVRDQIRAKKLVHHCGNLSSSRRSSGGKPTVEPARIQVFIIIQQSTRHDTHRQRTRGSMVGEEATFTERLVARLLSHLLTARAKLKDDQRQEKEPPKMFVSPPQLRSLL